jgi:putative endonuclease
MRVKDAVGRFGEDTAAKHLTEAGLTILARNWHAAGIAGGDVRGELDIVARDGNALVVVEVKTRSSTRYGSPAESVTPDKVRRVRRLAVAWLSQHPDWAPQTIRFDLVSVLRTPTGLQIDHLRSAF